VRLIQWNAASPSSGGTLIHLCRARRSPELVERAKKEASRDFLAVLHFFDLSLTILPFDLAQGNRRRISADRNRHQAGDGVADRSKGVSPRNGTFQITMFQCVDCHLRIDVLGTHGRGGVKRTSSLAKAKEATVQSLPDLRR
jgi:hypothetical protein